MGAVKVGLKVETGFVGSMKGMVVIGDFAISLPEFLKIVEYVLINTDLEPGDPRLEFLRKIGSVEEVDGFNPGQKRLQIISS